MALLINKWLLILATPLLLNSVPGPTNDKKSIFHPFHVSVTEINHNASEKTLEMSFKLFTDDFEKALTKFSNTPIDLIHPKDRAATTKVINDYVHKNFQVRVDGHPVMFACIGFEEDSDGLFCYFQADNVTAMKKVELVNSLMYEMFDDQVSIMHVIEKGERKSTKLNYPNKEVSVSF
jgi:hypothetical protein